MYFEADYTRWCKNVLYAYGFLCYKQRYITDQRHVLEWPYMCTDSVGDRMVAPQRSPCFNPRIYKCVSLHG
jgi:hypothetical protein